MSKRKHKKVPTINELMKERRGNWNGINPVTRVEQPR